MTETTWPFGTMLSKLLQRQQDVLAFSRAEGPAARQAVCPRCPGAGLAWPVGDGLVAKSATGLLAAGDLQHLSELWFLPV